jgi:predicted SAM-dependent methyltransferase
MLKLNLGCGIYYKPGYVNIDKFENLVADQQADLYFLPFSDNSVDEIEASHILEHFDIVHVPYLLAEWWRVLKPGGLLFLEIPNLWKSAVNIGLRTFAQKIQTIRFLFGVDLPGNFHKSGFTFRLLRNLLEKSGFVKCKKMKQVSFQSESGIRLRVEKSTKKINLIANIRLQILKQFPPPQVLLYSAIETNIINPLQSRNSDSIMNLIVEYSIFHPHIAHLVTDLLPKSKSSEIDIALLKFLSKIRLPSLLYANWIKWSKSTHNLQLEFNRFLTHWKKRVFKSFNGSVEPEKEYTYLMTQNALDTNNGTPFFSIEYVTLESQKFCNKGIKKFQIQELIAAKKLFELAIRTNPSNEIAYWNLSRIYGIEKQRRNALEHYQITRDLVQDKRMRKMLIFEVTSYQKTYENPKNPLQIRY